MSVALLGFTNKYGERKVHIIVKGDTVAAKSAKIKRSQKRPHTGQNKNNSVA